MATTSINFSPVGWVGGRRGGRWRKRCLVTAQQEDNVEQQQQQLKVQKQQRPLPPQQAQWNAKSKNMSREYGGQWLSCCTRHVRIYAAYIDPFTHAFDQTQMDKLTLMLDPTKEFVWTTQACNKVYAYFQELCDQYKGAKLTEYTLRLIGSDIEHCIRKMLYNGEIIYNMKAKVLNFSIGKHRFISNNQQLPNVQ
ncbi:hypothetical protein AAC387_Pa11g1873 [Persea americana]